MMEGFDLKGFEQFVTERDLVPEAHRSFYVHWVQRFLREHFRKTVAAIRDRGFGGTGFSTRGRGIGSHLQKTTGYNIS